MLSGYDDSYRTFSNNVSAGWVDGTTVTVDENIMKWVEQTKEYTDKGYNNKSSLWDSQWAADQGPTGKVIGFFYSTWGVDFALLDNRLNGSIEYYNKKGSDLLANTMGVPTEGWGYSTYTINNGKMTNQGFELTLSGDIIRTNDWNWNVSGVLGYNKNEVTYVNVEAPVAYLVIDYPTAYPRIGNPYKAINGYQRAGLSATGTPQVYDAEGNLFTDMAPTEIEDLIYLGTTVPTYTGSINTNLRWKNWELAAQFAFEGGHKMRNTNLAYISSGMAPVSASIADRWMAPGDEAHTDVPRYISSESPDYNYEYYNMYARASVNVISAANWRMKNLSLTYRIPADFCRSRSLQSARIMLGMENVFTAARSRDA